ncbi:MAG: DNA-3-methyladenine glycosylase [Chlamydiota bacterium]
MTPTILPLSFYQRSDVVAISKELLGKTLLTEINGQLTGGTIVETEAYAGPEDKACHAYGNRRTKRTEPMFQAGGTCYIYTCYGIHLLLNIVTYIEGIPHAVLIRALEPTFGVEMMLKRRNKPKLDRTLTGGPGALSQALGITKDLSGQPLGTTIRIKDHGTAIASDNVMSSPRVGIAYAEEDALLPWRFRIKDNPWTSPAK